MKSIFADSWSAQMSYHCNIAHSNFVHLPSIEVDSSTLALHLRQILWVPRWLTSIIAAFNILLHPLSSSACLTSQISPTGITHDPWIAIPKYLLERTTEDSNWFVALRCLCFLPREWLSLCHCCHKQWQLVSTQTPSFWSLLCWYQPFQRCSSLLTLEERL